MTHDRKGKRRQQWGGSKIRTMGGYQAPPRRTERRDGIRRAPRERTAASLPLTDFQAAVLAQVTPEPISAAVVADLVRRSRSSVTSALYRLADRGLVERLPYRGWRLTP